MTPYYETDDFRQMIEKGRMQGFMTFDELNNTLPMEMSDPETLETLLEMLERLGIPVVETDPLETRLEETMAATDAEIAAIEEEPLEDSVRMWIRQASRVPLLNPQKEQTLARLARMGDEQARWTLAHANFRLVISIARRYVGRGMPISDLIQEGNIGLMRAIERFDEQKGCRFSTYASWWIKQAITRALKEQARLIRLPNHMMQNIQQLVRVSNELQQMLGRKPSIGELANGMNMTPEQITNLMKVIPDAISLEMPVTENEEVSLLDKLMDEESDMPDTALEREQIRERIEDLLDTLTERERAVITLRYGLSSSEPMTLEEIGQHMQLTRERVRQLEARALKKLRGENQRKDQEEGT